MIFRTFLAGLAIASLATFAFAQGVEEPLVAKPSDNLRIKIGERGDTLDTGLAAVQIDSKTGKVVLTTSDGKHFTLTFENGKFVKKPLPAFPNINP